MKIKDGYILKEFGGEAVVIESGTANGRSSVIELNESGIILWKALEKGADINALAAALTAEYDIDDATARQDAEKFAETLKNAGVISEE